MNELILEAGSRTPLPLALLPLMIDICVHVGKQGWGGEEGGLNLLIRPASGPKEGQGDYRRNLRERNLHPCIEMLPAPKQNKRKDGIQRVCG